MPNHRAAAAWPRPPSHVHRFALVAHPLQERVAPLLQQPLARSVHHLLHFKLVVLHLVPQLRSAPAEHPHGEQSCVRRVPDRDGRHRHAPRHLHYAQQRVLPVERGGLDRDPDHGEGGHGRDHAREVGRAARPGDHGLQAPSGRRAGVRHELLRRSVRADDVHLVGDPELLQDFDRVVHRGQVGLGAHDDAHQRTRADPSVRGQDVLAYALRFKQLRQRTVQLGVGVGGDVDVSHLSARAVPLSVPMDVGAGHGHSKVDPFHCLFDSSRRSAENVDHRGRSHDQLRVPQRQPAHRPQVVLELARRACVLRVVPRVVRPGRHLVQEYLQLAAAANFRQEQLHAEHARGPLPQRIHRPHRDLLAPVADVRGDVPR
eukprot:CAMPEP_0172544546 /NCGR_PEP_ID=MMETSP1067-20121228/14678_1 /TAXON_ID=265564 ORGANISM="Thalassiosira punctigera, Strain Tpunct2005C2" /NCGR_SAMPLE_ID=MMETSP1067 /ASSEMBLY_ACC=CAM_ASM_000444 /LENGTH=372 /DNA_ID=CAMNT_0013331125 /DNA_START=23 /DNA_END=1137 /DNA_ORIENTATION=-